MPHQNPETEFTRRWKDLARCTENPADFIRHMYERDILPNQAKPDVQSLYAGVSVSALEQSGQPLFDLSGSMHRLAVSSNQVGVRSRKAQPCTGIVSIERIRCRVDDRPDRVFLGAITRPLGVARHETYDRARDCRDCDELESIHLESFCLKCGLTDSRPTCISRPTLRSSQHNAKRHRCRSAHHLETVGVAGVRAPSAARLDRPG